MPRMSNDDAANKDKKHSMWDVRSALGSLEAMRRYDSYLQEHRRRLRQLEKEAAGEMSPSDEWYA
jgi:hypothetical protein